MGLSIYITVSSNKTWDRNWNYIRSV